MPGALQKTLSVYVAIQLLRTCWGDSVRQTAVNMRMAAWAVDAGQRLVNEALSPVFIQAMNGHG